MWCSLQKTIFDGSRKRRKIFFCESHDRLEDSESESREFPVHGLFYVLEDSLQDSAACSALDANSSNNSSRNLALSPPLVNAGPDQDITLPTGGHGEPDTLVRSGDWTFPSSASNLSGLYDLSNTTLDLEKHPPVPVALLTGGPTEEIHRAAAFTAAAVERNLMEVPGGVEDHNVPMMSLNINGLSPEELITSVDDLLRPLKPYVYKPRLSRPSSPTSDRAESVTTTTPPLSPSRGKFPDTSLSPIWTPVSPTDLLSRFESQRLTPRPTPTPNTPADRVELRTSTALTPLQEILDSVNRAIVEQEEMENEKEDVTMTSI